AAGEELAGTYRLTSSTWTPAPTATVPVPEPVTVEYDAYDWTEQNLGSSNMMTRFNDGTLLYGTHGYNAGNLPAFQSAGPFWGQVEHGFYDYDPVAGSLRFTLITATNPTIVYPPTFGATTNLVWNASRTGTPGLSATPDPIVTGAPAVGAGIGIWNAVMNNVQKGTVPFNLGRSASAPQTLRSEERRVG